MKKLMGKKVQISVLDYLYAFRNGNPEEVTYEGVVTAVSNHMIQLSDCQITKDHISRKASGVIWFNTMASSFQSIVCHRQ